MGLEKTRWNRNLRDQSKSQMGAIFMKYLILLTLALLSGCPKWNWCEHEAINVNTPDGAWDFCYDQCYLATVGSYRTLPGSLHTCLVDRCGAQWVCKDDHSVDVEHPNGAQRLPYTPLPRPKK